MGFSDNRVLGLHDGQLESYTSRGDKAIEIRTWDESLLSLTMVDSVYLREQVGDDALEGLYEFTASPLLGQAIAYLKALRWSDEALAPLRHFQLMDGSGYAVLDVIARR